MRKRKRERKKISVNFYQKTVRFFYLIMIAQNLNNDSQKKDKKANPLPNNLMKFSKEKNESPKQSAGFSLSKFWKKK